MKPKSTIILIALLIVVGLGVWISKQVKKRSDPERITTPRRVFPTATGQVRKMTLESREGTKLVFVRSEGRWNMIEPRLLPAKAETLNEIVRTLTNLQYRRVLDPNALADGATGLENPRWTVAFTDEADKSHTLQVGRPAPKLGGTDETYVRPDNEKRTLVAQCDLARLLRREVKEYREMTVLPEAPPDRITAIRVEGRETYALQNENGVWSVTKPYTAQADTSAVGALLQKLTSDLKAQRFLAEAPTSLVPFGLDTPQLAVTITARSTPATPATTQAAVENKIYTVLLGHRRGKSVCAMVKGQPEVFTLPESALSDLQPSLESLQSKDLLRFQPLDVDRITIREGDKVTILRRGKKWTLAQPFAGPADDQAVARLLQTLSGLRAESWIAPRAGAPRKLPSPRATIDLHVTHVMKNATEKLLRIGSVSGDKKTVFCQPAGSDPVATVKAQSIEELLAPARAYWSKSLLPLPANAVVQGMTLDRKDGTYVLARQGDQWILAAPAPGRADDKVVRRLVGDLRTQRAENIVALGESLPKKYANAKPRVTISLTAKANGETTTYRLVVVKIMGRAFAWREGVTPIAVGTCPASLYDHLTQPMKKE